MGPSPPALAARTSALYPERGVSDDLIRPVGEKQQPSELRTRSRAPPELRTETEPALRRVIGSPIGDWRQLLGVSPDDVTGASPDVIEMCLRHASNMYNRTESKHR